MYRILRIAMAVPLLLGATEISNAQTTSDLDAVRAANQAYYAALSARDIEAMEKVWSQSEDDVNVAPPIRPAAHVGWPAIKKQYETFWATLDELTVSMQNPTIRIEGDVAWVYGTEQARRKPKGGEVSSGPNFGTSIFVKRDGKWLMVFHQAALIPQQGASAKK